MEHTTESPARSQYAAGWYCQIWRTVTLRIGCLEVSRTNILLGLHALDQVRGVRTVRQSFRARLVHGDGLPVHLTHKDESPDQISNLCRFLQRSEAGARFICSALVTLE